MSIVQTLKKKVGRTIEAKADESADQLAENALTPVDKPKSGTRTETPRDADTSIIQNIHVTEKTTALREKNQYTFLVRKGVTKKQAGDEIAKRYHVSIEHVRMVNVPRKMRMRGRLEGWRKGYRKAIARIKQGQVIDIQ